MRFHARLMPLSHTFYAHCPICGNLELRRIAPEHVNSITAFLWKILRIPAFRCDPCRYKYFSILPLHSGQKEEVGVPSGD
jgi:C4-type Zn-finger protein